MVSADFGSRGHEFESHGRQNPAQDCTARHCLEPFIITLPLPQKDLCNVEKDLKHQTIIISL